MSPALLAALLITQSAPPAETQPSASRTAAEAAHAPLSPEALRQLDVLRGRVQALRKKQAAEGAAGSLAEQLRRRVELDQFVRKVDGALGTEFPRLPDEIAVRRALGADAIAIDRDNTSWLKSVLPSEGWFRKSRHGEAVLRDAWILLIHSPDDAFLERTLARMEPLARAGEVDAADFANRFDRVAVLAGRPQRYGSHAGCIDGYKAHYPFEGGRAAVEARRKELRLPPLAARTKALDVGNWCGGAAWKPR